jgi:hypothetical protein
MSAPRSAPASRKPPTSFADVQKAIRKIIPPQEIETLADNIGMPISGINMTYNNTGVIGPQDGDIQIKLKEGHRPTDEYVQACASSCRGVSRHDFSFLPADIVSQILNFGAPAPIDLQIRGADLEGELRLRQQAAEPHPPHSRHRRCAHPAIAQQSDLQRRCRPHPGAICRADRARRHQQPGGQPRRQLAGRADLLAQSRQRRVLFDRDADAAIPDDSLSALQNLPITAPAPQSPILGGIADIKRATASAVVSQYDIQPMVQIYATPQGRDLGAVAADVRRSSTRPRRRCRRASQWCCSARCRP